MKSTLEHEFHIRNKILAKTMPYDGNEMESIEIELKIDIYKKIPRIL